MTRLCTYWIIHVYYYFHANTVRLSLLADNKRLGSAHLVPEVVNASIAIYRTTSEGQGI